MADLPKIDRPQRRIPQLGELDGITMIGRGLGQAGARLNPNGLVSQAPLIDARGFIDESRGMAAAGRAVQDIGAATMRLAEEAAIAKTDKQKMAVKRALGGVQSEMVSALVKEPDDEKYEEIFRTHLDKARSVITETKMTEAATADAEEQLADWEVWQRNHVSNLQAQKIFAGARDELQAGVTEAINRKDFAGARAALDTRQARLYLGDARVAAEIGQIDREEVASGEKSAFDMHFAALSNDPAAWKQQNSKPWPGREALWSRLKNQADAREREIGAEAVDTVQQAIIDGDIDVPEEIDAINIKGLTPQLREALKADLLKFDRAASDEEKRVNGEKNWLEAWKAAREWKGGESDEAAKEYHQMTRSVRYGVPDDNQGKIFEILYRKMGLTPKELPPAPEVVTAADKILDTYWDDGTFNGGNPMRGFDAEGRVSDLPNAIRNSAGVEASVRQKVNNYLKQNPNTKPEEVGELVRRFLPDGVRSSMLRKLQSDLYNPQGSANSEAAQARPMSVSDITLPVSGDLPDAGGSIDDSLLPQIPPFKAE